MSSGSALLSGSDFSVLDRFQFALTVTFFFCPVSAGIHLGNANVISTKSMSFGHRSSSRDSCDDVG